MPWILNPMMGMPRGTHGKLSRDYGNGHRMERAVACRSKATAWSSICMFGPYLVCQSGCSLWSTVCVVVVLLSVVFIRWTVYVSAVLFMCGKIWLSKPHVIIITNNWPTRSPLFGNRSDHNVYNIHVLCVHCIQWILLPAQRGYKWQQHDLHWFYGQSNAHEPMRLYVDSMDPWISANYIVLFAMKHNRIRSLL